MSFVKIDPALPPEADPPLAEKWLRKITFLPTLVGLKRVFTYPCFRKTEASAPVLILAIFCGFQYNNGVSIKKYKSAVRIITSYRKYSFLYQ